jgi:leader peptidase (prepilin peptidase)/N-methyltransferase
VELADRSDRGAAPPGSRWRGLSIVRELPRREQIAVAVLSAALAVACVVRFGFGARALIGAVFAATLVVLAAIDLDRRLIPNSIVLPALAFVLTAQIVFFPEHWLEWVLASVLAALFFYVPMLVYPAGMGMGDVKLAALMGAALGKSVVAAIFIGLLAGAAFSIALLVREGLGARRKGFAYGPFLALGGLIVLLLGGH